ncbi:MAG: SIS domain-containing protein [Acidobacteria bacterium]|nr:SIS domain-containing protein [Acidobacteriota bacterium]
MEVDKGSVLTAKSHTWFEIAQQPELWPTTLEHVKRAVHEFDLVGLLSDARVVLTGAGTSAYIASAIAPAWHKAIAVPSTDLLVDTERYVAEADVLISIGRSGNSPESMAVVDRVHALRPQISQLAITCNGTGALAKSDIIRSILLDPRTDDKSLVMTSSFSNLVIGGLCLARAEGLDQMLPTACAKAKASFAEINSAVKHVASIVKERIVLLASSPLLAWAQEGSLKSLEMTAGRFPVLAETYLGLRHGPMSFVRPDTVVLCLLSNDPLRRRYERDLVQELRSKNLGHLVAIGATREETDLFDAIIPATSPQAADELRTPFEIIAPQLLGYYLSLRVGLDPDNPSEDGIITRVVQGVRIYKE